MVDKSGLGQFCSGGTSDGDSVAFTDSTCKAGVCIVDATGGQLATYCSADCSNAQCPSGYLCKATTIGGTNDCFIDPNSSANDGGSSAQCVQPTGTYATHFVARDSSCPPQSDSTVTYDLTDAGTGCTQTFDASSCLFTTNCSTTDDQGTVTTQDVVTVSASGTTLTDVLTVTVTSNQGNLTCIYDVTDTKQ